MDTRPRRAAPAGDEPVAAVPAWHRWLRVALALSAVMAFGVYCVGLPVQAASLAASSASSALDSLSTSVGAFSNAVSGVSTSSSGGGKVAQGEYRIEKAQTLPGVPMRVALDLEPAQAASPQGARAWQLRLPAEVVAAAELEPGQVLAVRDRPYGFGLWRAGAAQPFYLVVQDDWMQALQVRPVDGR